MRRTVSFLTAAGLCALTVPVLGASPNDRRLYNASTVTPLPIDVGSGPKILDVRDDGMHLIVKPTCGEALKDLTSATAELSNDMQDGLMEWWSQNIEDPLPTLPLCLQHIASKMDTATARKILTGKLDSIYDDPAMMQKIKMWIGPLGACKDTIDMTDVSSFHGRGGALHLVVRFAAWLRRRPDRQEKLKRACTAGQTSTLDRRYLERSPCTTASKVLSEDVASGLAGNPWQHRVQKWWSRNHNRLLRLLHSDYHNGTNKEVQAAGPLKGEYDDIIGIDDPVVLLDNPHCNSVCREMVRIAGVSGIYGQWGSFHFMLEAREWMVLHPPAVAAWEDACLHQGEPEESSVEKVKMLDVRGGVDVPEAIRRRDLRRPEGEIKRRLYWGHRNMQILYQMLPMIIMIGILTGVGVYLALRLIKHHWNRWARVGIAVICGLCWGLVQVLLVFLVIWELVVLLLRSPRKSVFRWFADKARSAKTEQATEPARNDEHAYSL